MTDLKKLTGAAALAASVCLGASACSGLEFVQDRRLSFTSPAANKLTKLPVTLSWSMKDFAAGPTTGSYAVFIDQAPIKVGQTLQSEFGSERVKATPALLATLDIYPTSTTSITLTRVPPINNDSTTRQRHSATVVLLDASGKRVNESAWTQSFDLNSGGDS